MNNETPLKLNELRDELYRDYSNKSRWIYVKMQSILEYINKRFIELSLDKDCSIIFNNSNIGLTRYLLGKHAEGKSIMHVFQIINRFANIVKHSTDGAKLKEVSFNESLVNSFIKEYNNYCKILFKKEYSIYLLSIKSMHEIKETKIQQEFEKSSILVPCGVGMSDFGFEIRGLRKIKTGSHIQASVYAVIYNFMKRSSQVKKPYYIINHENESGYNINFRNVFKYMMIILNMIRKGYFEKDELNINTYEGSLIELELSVETINWYAAAITSLQGKRATTLKVVSSKDSYSISIHNNKKADIYCVDFEEEMDGPKDVWYEKSIRYSVKESGKNIEYLNIFLMEFFNYKSFKPGQLHALIKVLKSNENQIIMLPTGGGKSLLYYFMALLQPNPTIIISPTNLLIKDQIRNLLELHDIDDCKGYYSGPTSLTYKDLDIKFFDFSYKFIFITPEVLQQKKIIKDLIDENLNNRISNVILDEVHFLSNWSHGFRPDYLMLSHNLLVFLDHARYLGFTATASYRVLDDVIRQLKIKEENIIVPIELKRNNIDYSFIQYNEEKELPLHFRNEVNMVCGTGNNTEKVLVFANNELVNSLLFSEIDEEDIYNLDIYTEQNPYSYEGFITGRKSILVSDEEMGVGVNIPMVKKVVHFGLPVSKGQYVQELGRVERFEGTGISTVYYKPIKNMSDIEKSIVNFDTPIDKVLENLMKLEDQNDIKKVYKKMLGHLEHYSIMSEKTYSIFNNLTESKRTIQQVVFEETSADDILKQQICLYFLFVIGVINNWHIIHTGNKWVVYEVSGKMNQIDINEIKRRAINYISSLNQDKKTIFNIEKANQVKSIINEVQYWYYNNFILYHREQFLNLLDFFDMNTSDDTNSKAIAKLLSDYFVSPLFKYENIEEKNIKDMSFQEIIDLVLEHKSIENAKYITHMEQMLENEYNIKYELYVLVYHIIVLNYFNYSRLERIISNLNEIQKKQLIEVVDYIYPIRSDIEERISCINVLKKQFRIEDILEGIYTKVQKDIIYYSYLSKVMNIEFKLMIGG